MWYFLYPVVEKCQIYKEKSCVMIIHMHVKFLAKTIKMYLEEDTHAHIKTSCLS